MNMKIFGCKAVEPCESIDIAEPVGYHKFIVPDDELEHRVDEVLYSCFEYIWTDEGVISGDVNIACYDNRLMRFATICIDKNRKERVLFVDPDAEYVPCSRASFYELIGCSSFCRVSFRSPCSDTMSCKVDIVRRRYYEDYFLVWG